MLSVGEASPLKAIMRECLSVARRSRGNRGFREGKTEAKIPE